MVYSFGRSRRCFEVSVWEVVVGCLWCSVLEYMFRKFSKKQLMKSLFQHCWLSLIKHCLQSFRKTNFATAFTKLISRLQTKGLARKISARPLCWTIHQLLKSVEFHTSIQLLREKILLVSFLIFVYQKCQQQQQQINVSTEQPSTPSFQLNHSNSIVQLLYTIQI